MNRQKSGRGGGGGLSFQRLAGDAGNPNCGCNVWGASSTQLVVVCCVDCDERCDGNRWTLPSALTVESPALERESVLVCE